MVIDLQTRTDALIARAVSVLSPPVIGAMSEPQRTLLSRSLDRILASHGGTIDTITDDEIIGTYERVVFDLLPDAFVEAFIAAAAKRRRVGG